MLVHPIHLFRRLTFPSRASTPNFTTSKHTVKRTKSKTKSKSTPAKDQTPQTKSTKVSTKKCRHVNPEAIARYLDDVTHSNPGYSYTHTDVLVYSYGYPSDAAARLELEKNMINEGKERSLGAVEAYKTQMERGIKWDAPV
jgi:hypothetical protein